MLTGLTAVYVVMKKPALVNYAVAAALVAYGLFVMELYHFKFQNAHNPYTMQITTKALDVFPLLLILSNSRWYYSLAS